MNGTHIQLILAAAMLLAIHVLDVNREVLLRTTGNDYPTCGMVTVAMGTNATAKTTAANEMTVADQDVLPGSQAQFNRQALALLDEKSGATAKSIYSDKSGNTARSANTARSGSHTDLFAAVITSDVYPGLFAEVTLNDAASSNARVLPLEANIRHWQ